MIVDNFTQEKLDDKHYILTVTIDGEELDRKVRIPDVLPDWADDVEMFLKVQSRRLARSLMTAQTTVHDRHNNTEPDPFGRGHDPVVAEGTKEVAKSDAILSDLKATFE